MLVNQTDTAVFLDTVMQMSGSVDDRFQKLISALHSKFTQVEVAYVQHSERTGRLENS